MLQWNSLQRQKQATEKRQRLKHLKDQIINKIILYCHSINGTRLVDSDFQASCYNVNSATKRSILKKKSQFKSPVSSSIMSEDHQGIRLWIRESRWNASKARQKTQQEYGRDIPQRGFPSSTLEQSPLRSQAYQYLRLLPGIYLSAIGLKTRRKSQTNPQ